MHRLNLVLGAGLVALLAGCAFQPIGTFDRPDYIVRAAARAEYDLRFFPGQPQFAPGEDERLAQFIVGLGLTPADEVLLTVGDSGSATLDRRRALLSTEAIEATGVLAAIRVVDTRTPERRIPGRDTVFVEALRGGQLLVACPSQYLGPYEEAYAGARLPQMNCANAANLAHQAAARGDLVNPRRLGPSDGTTSAAAVIRYREDRIKQPPSLAGFER